MRKLTMLLSFFYAVVLVAAEPAPVSEVHSRVAPSVTFHQHQGGDINTKNIMFGVEHRYEKAEGINTKLHFSAMKQSDRTHYHFLVEGLYKFQAQNNIAVYPLAGLSWYRFAVSPDTETSSKYLSKNMVHGGLGIEKCFYKFLTLGVKGHIGQEVDARTYEDTGKLFAGSTHSNCTEWRVTGYFHLSFWGNGAVELEPFFGKCFEGKYQDHGAKMAYSFKF